ncbi:hypothetical protein B7463_g11565, partial [Scytalidium lignicola]
MSVAFTTKRPHRKSRAGCKGCKTRKIKCDEKQPICTFCALRDLQCVYGNTESRSSSSYGSDVQVLARRTSHLPYHQSQNWAPTPSPSCSPPPYLTPSLSPTSGTLTMFDMRLLHHYSTNTYQSLVVGGGETMKVLQIRIPELAFESESDFLMRGILAIASMHIDYLNGRINDVCKPSDIYQMKAIRAFREVLSNQELINRAPEAIAAMAALLLVMCRKTEPPHEELNVLTWFGLFSGMGDLIMTWIPEGVSKSSIYPIFRRTLSDLKSVPVVPSELINMLGSITPQDPDFLALKDYCKTLDSFGALYASLKDDGISDALSIRIVTWPSYVPKIILNSAKERRPRALVIVAYYLVFTKLIKNMWWWHGGSADREIDVICGILAPNFKFRALLKIPMIARNMNDLGDIKSLLLGNPLSSATTPDPSASYNTTSGACTKPRPDE